MNNACIWKTAVLTIAFLGAATAAWAHHSFGAEYDASKSITVTGVVTEVQWTNPHIYFFLDAKGKGGQVEHWKFEGYPPGVLNRIGWRRNVTMVPGDTVTVTGWRARDGAYWGQSREVTFAKDGKKLQSGPPAGNGDGGNRPPVIAKQ
jgi:hypothetical protein